MMPMRRTLPVADSAIRLLVTYTSASSPSVMLVQRSNENAHQLLAIVPAPAQTYASFAALTEGAARAEPGAPSGPSAACAG
jgi:hypothetical protein